VETTVAPVQVYETAFPRPFHVRRACVCVTVADACLRVNGASYNIRGVRASGGTSVGMSPGRGRAFYIHREDIIFTGSLKKRANARANK